MQKTIALALIVLASLALLGCTSQGNNGIPQNSGNASQPALAAKPAWNANAQWQKPADAQLKAMLTPMQYEVTQDNGTEPAFGNEYWNNEQDGIYVDIVSGEPLFSSKDKFDSGTGWPSFTKPINDSAIATRTDSSLGLPRIEVRSSLADSHLGHVFDDGPPPSYLRYCMNSAALRFIPKENMAALGYGAYLAAFSDS